MFEGTLVESQGFAVSGTKRWTAVASVVVQCCVAGLLVAIPLLRPEALPMLIDAPRLVVPLPMKPPPPVVKVPSSNAAATSAMSAAVVRVASVATTRFVFPRDPGAEPGPAPAPDMGLHMGDGGSGPLAAMSLGDGGHGVAVVRAKDAGPTRVSKGVLAGMLLTPINPVYPPIARAARVEGAVVMEATISKAGRIESLRAVSGPEMLLGAALDAVKTARYKPYELNGEATEVQTTITVNFRLGS